MRTVNVTNIVVVAVVLLILILIVIHLIRVYRKSPCGDCASAKQCSSFSKKKILKAYKKQCKIEEKQEKN